jgi:hypothetical protein
MRPDTYTIDGRSSDILFTDAPRPEWRDSDLYGDVYLVENGRAHIAGRKAAIAAAAAMFDTFSPPGIDTGDVYLVRYDVRDPDGNLVARFERVETGA